MSKRNHGALRPWHDAQEFRRINSGVGRKNCCTTAKILNQPLLIAFLSLKEVFQFYQLNLLHVTLLIKIPDNFSVTNGRVNLSKNECFHQIQHKMHLVINRLRNNAMTETSAGGRRSAS
jgi:hypothetical protein